MPEWIQQTDVLYTKIEVNFDMNSMMHILLREPAPPLICIPLDFISKPRMDSDDLGLSENDFREIG